MVPDYAPQIGDFVDINTLAFKTVQLATTETKTDKRRDMARSAGKIGGLSRAKKLSPERRREIATSGSNARWTSPS